MIEIFIFHMVVTWFMTGLIWFIQVVHYPLFARVGKNHYEMYQTSHMRLTTWVVGPPMVIEALTGVALLFVVLKGIPPVLVWANLGLLGMIWISTVLWQVPQHNTLLNGFNAVAHQRLIRSNWVRTFAWTVRALLLSGFLLVVLG